MGRKRGTKRKALEPPPLCFTRNTRLQTSHLANALADTTADGSVPGTSGTVQNSAPPAAVGAPVENPAPVVIPRAESLHPENNNNVQNNASQAAENIGPVAVIAAANVPAAAPTPRSVVIQSDGPRQDGMRANVSSQDGVQQQQVSGGVVLGGASGGGRNVSVGDVASSNTQSRAAAGELINFSTNSMNRDLLYDNHNSAHHAHAGVQNFTPFGFPSINNSHVSTFVNPSFSSQFTPLVSICNPLGDNLSQQVREKIAKGQFVDFALLINNKGGEVQDPFEQRALGFNHLGQVIIKDTKPQPKISGINSWTNAFLVFAAVYLKAHPSRTQEILKYGDLVRTAASRFGQWGWKEYDTQFRMRMQLHPERSWATIDGELWALYVAIPAPANVPHNNNNSQNSQVRGGVQSSQSYRGGSHSSGGSIPGSKNPCYDFNGQGCTRATCRFLHVCSLCKGDNHTANNCRSKS